MNVLAFLGIISGLSFNLILQFGLGIQHIGFDDEDQERFYELPLVQGGILFLSVPLLWVFFMYMVVPLSLGFLEYMLLFPLSVLVCMGLETAAHYFFPKELPKAKAFTPRSAYNGLIPAALLMSLCAASSLAEVIFLSLGFCGGVLLAILILREIQRGSSLEAVPAFLRGLPLTLISMGLLSLIFSAIGVILIKFLGLSTERALFF
jgi:electron transport complex protein RnfA